MFALLVRLAVAHTADFVQSFHIDYGRTYYVGYYRFLIKFKSIVTVLVYANNMFVLTLKLL